ncbi:MAG: bifunctional folylpolyglutamate synthase/dihydrofolate synthase [Oscillospiraceae bacterium]|nr:bifunctional folylpolyglutamate synthase/dihydrofolate synthase [Oscillospiraceae bacterium]
MDYTKALDYIHSLSKFGSKPGLDRVSRLVSLAGNPQKDLKFIHIAGTSGKGSTASYCAAILKEAGLRVGLYTSPYIIDFRERFQINGEVIDKEEFCILVERLIPIVEEINRDGQVITEFEFNTALGFLYFKQQKCDVVILEVGMGGRFDATNVIKNPLVSVITSIGLDHTDYLGDTIDKIAFEKCGIIKSACPVVSYPMQKGEAQRVISEVCAQKGSPLYLPSLDALKGVKLSLGASDFNFEGEDYTVNMAGEHQIYNAVTAITAVKRLEDYGFNVDSDSIKRGVAAVCCPARLEVINKKPLIIIDGAHNADKVKALYSYAKQFSGKIVSVCGMLRDKDYSSAAELIAPLCKSIVTVTPENPRALSAAELRDTLSQYCPDCTPAPSVSEGAKLAFSKMCEGDVLLCWGSLYIAGKVRQTILSII